MEQLQSTDMYCSENMRCFIKDSFQETMLLSLKNTYMIQHKYNP